MKSFNDAQFFSEKDNFSMGREQSERSDQGALVVDVVRKAGKHSEMLDDIRDFSELNNCINKCQIVTDDLKALEMTREDLEALDKCWERVSAFSTKLEDCSCIEDTLFSEDAVTMANLENMKDISYEKVVNPVKETQSKVLSKFFTGVDKQEFMYQPFEICQAVLRKNELCFLETHVDGTTLCRFNGMFWQTLDDEGIKQLIYNILPKHVKQGVKGVETLVSNVAAYIRREVKKAYDNGKKRFREVDYFKIQNRIVFQNCVYDVKERKCFKFSSKRPYAYQVKCNYVEKDLPTPYYDKLKRDATGGDEASMRMIDYMIAYLLIPNRTGKCFFTMCPAKDSGKNVLGEFIEKCFERICVCTMDTEFLGSNRFSSAGFDTARLLTCLEMPVKPLTVSAVKELKTFTGNSRIVVEQKYVKRTNADVSFKVLLATNGGVILPPGELDEAFYRRVVAIPFICSTPPDKLVFDLPQRLEKERSAIISKCVRAFGEIISEDGGVVFPESALSKALKAGWMGKSSFNECFVSTMLEYTAYDEDAIPKEDLELVYDVYYNENAFNDFGSDKPVHCSRSALVKVISAVYPGVTFSKRRRRTLLGQENGNGLPCVIGIRWTDKAQEMITEYIQDAYGLMDEEA